jgi:hypothetical protein
VHLQLWLCYKLPNEIVSRRDPEGRRTLFDRLKAMQVPDVDALRSVVRELAFVEHLQALPFARVFSGPLGFQVRRADFAYKQRSNLAVS